MNVTLLHKTRWFHYWHLIFHHKTAGKLYFRSFATFSTCIAYIRRKRSIRRYWCYSWVHFDAELLSVHCFYVKQFHFERNFLEKCGILALETWIYTASAKLMKPNVLKTQFSQIHKSSSDFRQMKEFIPFDFYWLRR